MVIFGALAIGVASYQPGGFGGSINAPAGTDSAAGTGLLAKHVPSSSANPTNLVYKLSQPAWDDPAPMTAATSQLAASGLFTGVSRALEPGGRLPAAVPGSAQNLGNPAVLPAVPADHLTIPLAEYEAYRATARTSARMARRSSSRPA